MGAKSQPDHQIYPSQVGITKEGFSEPNLYAPSRTRASSDDQVVHSWIGSFDPIDSVGTIKLYTRVADNFLQWMSDRSISLRTLTVEDFTEWRDSLVGAVATRANRLAITKGLLTYAHKIGYLLFNVGSAVRAPKVQPDPNARCLTEMQVASMIHVARTSVTAELARSKARPRYLASYQQRLHLVLWTYYSGCRVSEIAALRFDDITARLDGDFNVSVLGKGRRRRVVCMPAWVVREVIRMDTQEGSRRVFSVSTRRLQTVIEMLGKEAGITKKIGPHHLRHANATHAIERLAPVHVVQNSLGHRSLQTLGVYLAAKQQGAAKYLPRFSVATGPSASSTPTP